MAEELYDRNNFKNELCVLTFVGFEPHVLNCSYSRNHNFQFSNNLNCFCEKTCYKIKFAMKSKKNFSLYFNQKTASEDKSKLAISTTKYVSIKRNSSESIV